MRTLYLMRHAKARSDAGREDLQRRLSRQGKDDALAMGALLADTEIAPDLVISSPARRATSTARRVSRAWGYTGEIQHNSRLYQQGREGWLAALCSLGERGSRVLAIGHNPEIEEIVFTLGGEAARMTTGAVVRIDLDIEAWPDLAPFQDGIMSAHWAPPERKYGGNVCDGPVQDLP